MLLILREIEVKKVTKPHPKTKFLPNFSGRNEKGRSSSLFLESSSFDIREPFVRLLVLPDQDNVCSGYEKIQSIEQFAATTPTASSVSVFIYKDSCKKRRAKNNKKKIKLPILIAIGLQECSF